jgi:drug/metabolite transporter (DMT)-like permease
MKTLGAGASGKGHAIFNPPPRLTRPRFSVTYWFAVFMLVLAACLWGLGNVVQNIVLHHISALALLFIRSTIALTCLTPLAIIEYRSNKIEWRKIWQHRAWLAATAISFTMGLACQTYGGQFTSATNLGFIINLCVLITPLLLFAVFGEKVRRLTLASCAICFVGAILLTGLHVQKPNIGDGLCLVGALFYAVWIISLDRTLKLIDAPILITAMQFAPLCLLGMALTVSPGVVFSADIWTLWPLLLFISVLSTCLSFLMAAYAQRLVQPVVASLIYSFEALFSAFGAWAILGEQLSTTAMAGAGMMFISIMVCQYCISKGQSPASAQSRKHRYENAVEGAVKPLS